MKYETRDDSVEYHGRTKAFKSTGWWCTSCDEAILEGPELEKAERAFVELRAEVDAVLLPEQVAAIRAKLKLSQREAGKLLGGGPRAFQKYEAGTTPVSAPMNNLLLLLANDPKRLDELKKAQSRTAVSSGRRASR
jgi:HTH-type transcriptional regulator/antitoxin MqsA